MAVPPSFELAASRTIFFFLILIAYLVFGALVLGHFRDEDGEELSSEVSKVDLKRSELLNVLWAETIARSENDWYELANQKMDIYEKILRSHSSMIGYDDDDSDFADGFQRAFQLVTTVGPIESETLTPAGRLFAFFYAIVGVPLALLYLGQCNRMVQALLSKWETVGVTLAFIFFGGIIYDIVDGGNDSTSFTHDMFRVFLLFSTIGERNNSERPLPSYFLSLVGLSLVSVTFITIQHFIERQLAGWELSFTRFCGQRWNEKEKENDRILEEDEEEYED